MEVKINSRMIQPTSLFLLLCPTLLFMGCGGGSASSGPNNPPSFQLGLDDVESVEFRVFDGARRPLMLGFRAVDPDADSLTYSIAGVDAQFFEIVGSELRFRERADYESLADANGDNRYQIQMQVSDGELADSVAVSVVVEDAIEARIILASPVDWSEAFWDRDNNYDEDILAEDREVYYANSTSGYYFTTEVCESNCEGLLVSSRGYYAGTGVWPVFGVVYARPVNDRLVVLSPLGSLLLEASQAQAVLVGLGISATLEQVRHLDPWAGTLAGDALAEKMLRTNQQLALLFLVARRMGASSSSPVTGGGAASGPPTPNPDPMELERSRHIYSELAALAQGLYAGFDGVVSLDRIDVISRLFAGIELADEISESERDYLAVVAAAVNRLIAHPDIDAIEESPWDVVLSVELGAALRDLRLGDIDLQAFAERTTPEALFGRVFPALELQDVMPPKLEALSRVNNFPGDSSLSYAVTDDASGISQVVGVLSNQQCELRFERNYADPLQASDTIAFSFPARVRSANYSLASLELQDGEGNAFDGLKLFGQSVSFVIDNDTPDTMPAELISYRISVDPMDARRVVVESRINESNGISTGVVGGASDSLDMEVQVLDETVPRYGYVSARLQAADLIDNGDGTFTATTYHDLGSEQAATDAELRYVRFCDVGMNLTELNQAQLAPLRE